MSIYNDGNDESVSSNEGVGVGGGAWVAGSKVAVDTAARGVPPVDACGPNQTAATPNPEAKAIRTSVSHPRRGPDPDDYDCLQP